MKIKKFLFTSLFLAASATFGMASPEDFKIPDLKVYSDVVSKTANDPISELLKLSPECQVALFSIVTSPEFLQCVPIPALLPLLPIVSDPSGIQKLLADPEGILTPVFDGICAAPKCSDKGVTGALQAVETGCKKDASSPLIQIITGVITFYSPLRDSICFKTNKGKYCLFDSLEKILALPPSPIKITGTIIDNIAFAEPKFICTPCNKAIVNTVFNFLDKDVNHSVEFLTQLGIPPTLLQIAKLGVAIKCGFQFIDGDVGDPEKTDPDNFNYQTSSDKNSASNLKEISLMTMIGAFLVSTLMI